MLMRCNMLMRCKLLPLWRLITMVCDVHAHVSGIFLFNSWIVLARVRARTAHEGCTIHFALRCLHDAQAYTLRWRVGFDHFSSQSSHLSPLRFLKSGKRTISACMGSTRRQLAVMASASTLFAVISQSWHSTNHFRSSCGRAALFCLCARSVILGMLRLLSPL